MSNPNPVSIATSIEAKLKKIPDDFEQAVIKIRDFMLPVLLVENTELKIWLPSTGWK